METGDRVWTDGDAEPRRPVQPGSAGRLPGQEFEEARAWASEGVRLALETDDAFNASLNRAVLGFLELSTGDAEARPPTKRSSPSCRVPGTHLDAAEPAIIPCVPDAVEALVTLGRPDEAEALVDRLERQGAALDRPWARACAWRGQGSMIAAARARSPRGRRDRGGMRTRRARVDGSNRSTPPDRFSCSARCSAGESRSGRHVRHWNAPVTPSRPSARRCGRDGSMTSWPGSAADPRAHSN